MKSYFFTGTPPNRKTTAQLQRDEFVRQLSRSGIPGISPDDWGNIFWNLSKHTQAGRVLIVLDEISWMLRHEVAWKSCLHNETMLAVA
jgi:hypothetical protein